MELKLMAILAILFLISQIKNIEPCSCGVANRGVKRIVGGVETEPHEYPWQVGLLHSKKGTHPWCGGSLISSETVLTAAHCTAGKKAKDISVVVGEHNIKIKDGEEKFAVKKIIDHPGYLGKRSNYDNDFSLLILEKPVSWSYKARPVCLPEGDASSYENIQATVSGWGTMSSMGKRATILQEVKVTTMKNSKCTDRTSSYRKSRITSNMLCAAYLGNDSCQGDSGGPLIAREDDGYYSQIGVVSWGKKCAQANAPGVYARVTSRLGWIKANWKGETCPTPAPGSSGMPRCNGEDDDCCTKENPCSEGEGDCDWNDQCRGPLVCGVNNCPGKGFRWDRSDDCCFSFENKPGPTKCNKKQPCAEGYGDCNYDRDCQKGLKCGNRNCPFGNKWFWIWMSDDCCKKK